METPGIPGNKGVKHEKTNDGCYIDGERGVAKVTDIDPADYPAILGLLPEGGYHIYDYQFFFRNLQENVADRVERFLEQQALDEAA